MGAGEEGRFPGFPDGGQESVPLPEGFFTELLPRMAEEDELRVSLQLLWRLHRQRAYPRAISEDELRGDPRLAGVNVARGLELSLGRGTFLAVEGKQGERWLTLNDGPGRRWARSLARGEAERPERPPSPGPGEDGVPAEERPAILGLYEEHIGLVPPGLLEELLEAQASYPPEWLQEAFGLAARSRVSSWRYVRAILNRWEREGKDRGASQRDPDPERLRQLGKYGDYLRS